MNNRTKKREEKLKKIHTDLEIIRLDQINQNTPYVDMIINATSLGLAKSDEIKINYKNFGKNKLFYDVIYNHSKTNFLLKAEEFGNQVINGKMMFIFQAQAAFKIWHDVTPNIDNASIDFLNL